MFTGQHRRALHSAECTAAFQPTVLQKLEQFLRQPVLPPGAQPIGVGLLPGELRIEQYLSLLSGMTHSQLSEPHSRLESTWMR